MLGFQAAGAQVFDNGNLIRTQAKAGGVADAFRIPIFTEGLSSARSSPAASAVPLDRAVERRPDDIARIGRLPPGTLPREPDCRELDRPSPATVSPWRACRRASPGSDTASAPQVGLAVNRMVREGRLSGPVAFTRDHLDAGAMAHPNIMTENLRDGSDAVADWPLLNAMAHCASQADLVAIHSGRRGLRGLHDERRRHSDRGRIERGGRAARLSLTNDTAIGIMRYADAGYEEAREEAWVESSIISTSPTGPKTAKRFSQVQSRLSLDGFAFCAMLAHGVQAPGARVREGEPSWWFAAR
jgi:urocanate hydratase